jgi:hypothetical protein
VSAWRSGCGARARRRGAAARPHLQRRVLAREAAVLQQQVARLVGGHAVDAVRLGQLIAQLGLGGVAAGGCTGEGRAGGWVGWDGSLGGWGGLGARKGEDGAAASPTPVVPPQSTKHPRRARAPPTAATSRRVAASDAATSSACRASVSRSCCSASTRSSRMAMRTSACRRWRRAESRRPWRRRRGARACGAIRGRVGGRGRVGVAAGRLAPLVRAHPPVPPQAAAAAAHPGRREARRRAAARARRAAAVAPARRRQQRRRGGAAARRYAACEAVALPREVGALRLEAPRVLPQRLRLAVGCKEAAAAAGGGGVEGSSGVGARAGAVGHAAPRAGPLQAAPPVTPRRRPRPGAPRTGPSRHSFRLPCGPAPTSRTAPGGRGGERRGGGGAGEGREALHPGVVGAPAAGSQRGARRPRRPAHLLARVLRGGLCVRAGVGRGRSVGAVAGRQRGVAAARSAPCCGSFETRRRVRGGPPARVCGA